MTAPNAILEFAQVTFDAYPPYETGLWNISFALPPGALLLVRLEPDHECVPLADAAEGLVAPAEGRVSFLGEDWQTRPADRAAELRGRIGRVFEDEGWISDMAVDQNIMLAQLHHTERSEAEIQQEALLFARLFGLPGLPRGQPAKTRRLDLRKAACIRAFLGQPTLILLERLPRDVDDDLIAPLVNTVQSARKRGAAVVWTTSHVATWNNAGLRATARAKLFGAQMHLMEPEA